MFLLLVELRYLPAEQSTQVEAAMISEYFPCSHALQSVETALPGLLEYLPNVQLRQAVMEVDPGIGEYFPCMHSLQSVDW